MKNVIVGNHNPKNPRYPRTELDTLLRAQIENAMECGWQPDDILLFTNFEFAFNGVTARPINLNDFCFTGSKMFALQHLLQHWEFGEEIIWMHDLDCWQTEWFDCPVLRDVGICEYSQPKLNGGSVFWRRSARDIVEHVVRVLRTEQASREEPTLNQILKEDSCKTRVTVLNPSFNVGCSGFVERYEQAEKPVRVCHLHPNNRIAWETHALDRNGRGYRTVSPRLEALLRRYYPLAAELSAEGKAKQQAGRSLAPHSISEPEARPGPLEARGCYRLLRKFHLGDRWARLNCALRLLEAGRAFDICIRDDLTREIFDLLEIGGLRPILKATTPADNNAADTVIQHVDTGDTAYRCHYFPTKLRWQPAGQIISHSMAANYFPEEKVPPNFAEILANLQARLPQFQFIEVGKSHQKSLTDVVRVLAQSRLLFCVDNGIAHVARSVGVPLFLLEHRFSVKYGHPRAACSYIKVTPTDAVATIVSYLNTHAPQPQAKPPSQ